MRTRAVLLTLLAAAPVAAQQTPADSARVYELTEVEALPRPQNAAEFTAALRQGYPPHLRDAGVGGTVQVSFVLGPDGQPGDVRVLTTPDSAFNAPTMQAVSLLRFTPAQVQGRPVAVRVEQPVTWRAEPVVAARTVPVVPDSIQIYDADSVQVRPMPGDIRGFNEALRDLYPQELRAENPAALVRVRFAVDPAGQPRYPAVVESNDPRFDAVSLEAVGQLRFQPAHHEGEAVWVWMEVPLEWTQRVAASSGNAEDGYEMSAVDELPRPVNGAVFAQAMARAYPVLLRNAGITGSVQVRFLIGVDGSTSRHTITHSTDAAFNQPTLRALQVQRFRPARKDGRPVKVWVEQPIQWVVSGKKATSPP
ncbi:energy transducer TonB [Longimicrobium sp.]|uniref:energy transducer TonB n=1 Tax=Longimicrobium sp. TaxID=2029185 RepID=UPI003B3B82FE